MNRRRLSKGREPALSGCCTCLPNDWRGRARGIGWGRGPFFFFAIDEPDCISEWGHEFRPEYLQMSSLRKYFAEVPIAAFTASATQRVRHDIIAQLKLREPEKFIASF